jgi:hypothetical protein
MIVMMRKTLTLLTLSTLALAGCKRDGELDSSGGIVVTRSSCPAVAIPAYTGDVTFFNPPTSRDSRAIDIVANITNLTKACTDQGEDISSDSTFTVQARRVDNRGERSITLPYFVSVVQGGRVVVSKRVYSVALKFADGDYRATAQGTAGALINRSAATLPPEIQERITRRRKAGDTDAALDPFSSPEVKAAVQKASFEVLVGFQLAQDQLQYNATR